MLALAVAALTALMALAGIGSASATELTCGAAMCATETTIEAVNEGNIILDAPFGNVVCSGSTVKGHTTSTGSASETVSGPITTLSFTGCGSNTVAVLASGSLEIHTQGASANNNGRLTSTGAKVTVIHLGVHCIAETNATDIGTLTGSATTGGNATLDISATFRSKKVKAVPSAAATLRGQVATKSPRQIHLTLMAQVRLSPFRKAEEKHP